jgi:hypothetical protein
MRPLLVNRKPETSYRNGFIACSLSHGVRTCRARAGRMGLQLFENDPWRTAADFRQALESDFGGAFSDIVLAITDWSPEREFLGPFRDVFAAKDNARGAPMGGVRAEPPTP